MKELTKDLQDPNLVFGRLMKLEDRSRKNKLRIDRTTKQPGETSTKCED